MLVDLHPFALWSPGSPAWLASSSLPPALENVESCRFKMTPPRPAWIMGTGNYPVTIPKALASCISQLEGHFLTHNGRVGPPGALGNSKGLY